MTDALNPSAAKTGEPVAWLLTHTTQPTDVELATGEREPITDADRNAGWSAEPLYTHPQPSLSVGLDRERLVDLIDSDPAYISNVMDENRIWLAKILADKILALAAPAEGYVLVPVERLGAITDLSVNLRHGGCDASDLPDLELALETAIDIASDLLPAAPTGETGK